ncbi:MAG: NTP transferase domain-containing protein [Sphingomonas sp.]|nr:NTP transferase domain-containing protein [Sphingomonas sp.]
MRVLILAGGLGTRLRPAIGSTPKAMAPVAGHPFLEYLLGQAARSGFRRVALLTGSGAEVIERYFGNGTQYGLKIAYSREPEPLGTGGALRLAASRFPDERFLVMNGDSLFDIPLDRLVDTHDRTSARATLALARATERGRFGGVEVDALGRVGRFVEKGEPAADGLVNAGIYVVERPVLEGIEPGRAVSLEREVFPALVGAGLYAVPFEGTLVDIGLPPDLAALQAQPDALIAAGGGLRG